jgi:hypothetical protein
MPQYVNACMGDLASLNVPYLRTFALKSALFDDILLHLPHVCVRICAHPWAGTHSIAAYAFSHTRGETPSAEPPTARVG